MVVRAFESLPAGPPALRPVGFHPTYGGRKPHSPEMFALLALVGQLQHQVQDLQQQRTRLAREYARLDEQVRQAAEVQRNMMAAKVECPGVDVHTLYRPLDGVSGDIYDVARLDDNHLAISLADASGHGMPAALLSVMLKRSFRGQVILGDTRHILDAADVLQNVNRELLEAQFQQCQFVTGLHAVFHEPTRTLTLARGGQCYPLLLRPGCAPRQLVSHGPILGALEDATFETLQVQLSPGDRVVFYTDGVEALLLEHAGRPRPGEITASSWFAGLSAQSAESILADMAARLEAATPGAWPADDLTMITLTVRD